MKHTLSKLFSALSVLLLLAAVIFALSMRNAPPILAVSLNEAELQTEQFMEALCRSDYAAAEKLIAGSPTLTPNEDQENPLTQALWEAYLHSFSYEFHGSCYTDEYGLYRDVTVTVLDLPSLMTDLQSRPTVGLTNTDALIQAIPHMITHGDYTAPHHLTLQLTAHKGQWKIQPTPQLIALMQGSTGGT